MKERPILFSGEMVRAILDGRKTQTRRVIKPQPCQLDNGKWYWQKRTNDTGVYTDLPYGHWWEYALVSGECPYGVSGDLLWVRETWGIYSESWTDYGWEGDGIVDIAIPKALPPGSMHRKYHVAYKESGYEADEGEQWRPSIHMPRWASRITLEITSVRVERIQDISVEDMVAEGITPNMAPTHAPYWQQNTRHHFIDLWESINYHRGYGWDNNPWVWAITFKQVSHA